MNWLSSDVDHMIKSDSCWSSLKLEKAAFKWNAFSMINADTML